MDAHALVCDIIIVTVLLYHTATASYRLLPDITLTKHVTGKSAHQLKKCFPEGVIEIRTEEGTMVHIDIFEDSTRLQFSSSNLSVNVILCCIR